MSLHPIRAAWYNRPGWSPFGAWRVHGTHQGFDYYCKAGTPIYATGNGRVAGSGWHEDGHGHFVQIAYPGSIVVSYSHMQAPTGVPYSGGVSSGTRMGNVGDTGNAKGIVWWHPTAGPLVHVHVEVRRNGVLIDPLAYFNSLDGGLAGGGGTPIEQPPPPDPITETVDPMLVIRRAGTNTASLFHPSLSGTSALERGYIETSNQNTILNWERMWAQGSNSARTEPRDIYEAFQASARNQHAAFLRGIQSAASTPPSIPPVDFKPVLDAILALPGRVWSFRFNHAGAETTARASSHLSYGRKAAEDARDGVAGLSTAPGGIATDLQPILDAVASIPTAEENGQAARNAIVK